VAAVQLRQHQTETRKGLSLFILDSLLIGGLRFVLDKVAAAAEAELHTDAALHERLLEAEMRLELGEISEKEFAAIERDLLDRMRQVTRPPQEPITLSPRSRASRAARSRVPTTSKVGGVEVETWNPDL